MCSQHSQYRGVAVDSGLMRPAVDRIFMSTGML